MANFKHIALSCASLLVIACGRSSTTPRTQASSSLESVDIPQTEIEDQKMVGICWAYSAMGMIESQFKSQTKQDINLSEEALWFHHLTEYIYKLTLSRPGSEMPEAMKTNDLQGWMLKKPAYYSGTDAFDLLATYGVVPESEWSTKFDSQQKFESLMQTIVQRTIELTRNKAPGETTREQIIKEVLTAPGAFPSAPPTEFTFAGNKVSAKNFLSDTLKFDPTQFSLLEVKSANDYDRLVAATKRALVRGISVPLGFPVHFKRLVNGRFSGNGLDVNNPYAFVAEGGHAVLITDFVNKGSVRGALPADELAKEFQKNPAELDYFVFKNSWGKNAVFESQSGEKIYGAPDGFYAIDRDYLRGAASAAEAQRAALSIVVPSDIAANPFGAEPVPAGR